jgi:hypothetical protein
MSSMRAITITFLLALAAPAVEAIKKPRHHKKQKHAAEPAAPVVLEPVIPENPCECLKWKDVYSNNSAFGGNCGYTGRELSFADYPWLTKMGEGSKYCTNFFHVIEDNFCVNWNFDSQKHIGLQWCYVSSQCTTLGNGTRVNANLAYKSCTSEDQKLAAKKPPELAQIAKKDNVALGLLAKWAYTVAPTQWSNTSTALKQATKAASKAQGITALYDDTVDTFHDQLPYHLISGDSVYRISLAPGGLNEYEAGRYGNLAVLRCMENCGDN